MEKHLIREVLLFRSRDGGSEPILKCRVDQYRMALIAQGDTPSHSDQTGCEGIVNVAYSPSYTLGIQFLFNGWFNLTLNVHHISPYHL